MKNPFLKSLLTGVAALMFAAGNLQAADEGQLIAVLQSSAGVPEKAAACQQLRIHGTAASVPALAKLLTEERLSQAARYALEGMAVPEAGDALRDALGSTSGMLKAGIIDSLGWRQDAAAVPALVPLLSNADGTIVVATAKALGRIGGDASIQALQAVRGKMDGEPKAAIEEALLTCAERLSKEGKKEQTEQVYEGLADGSSSLAVRDAALRGSALSSEEGRAVWMKHALGTDSGLLDQLVDGIAEDSRTDPGHVVILLEPQRHVYLTALQLVRELRDEQVIETLLQEWPNLSAPAQLAVLDARLALGGDTAPTAIQASQSPHVTVRVRAWEALAELGAVASIPAMTRAAASGVEAEKDAARGALARIQGDGVGEALVAGLKGAQPAEQAELLRALGRRGDPSVAGVLLQYAKVGPAMVRSAALDSLTLLAVPGTLNPLLTLAASTTGQGDRDSVLKALYAVCQASPDKEQTTREVNSLLSQLPMEQQRRVLPVLADLATPDALKTLSTLARGTDLDAAKEAVRVLTLWPDATPSAHLLGLVSTTADPSLRTLALRGAITTAGLREDLLARFKLIRRALSLATEPAEQKLALGQLGQIPTRDAMDLALGYLGEPELVNEAALAVISVVEPLAKAEPALANAAAGMVLEKTEVPAIVQRAWALRLKPAAGGPFIRDWLVCGPYRQAGAAGALTLFNIAFGPEKPGEVVKWNAAPVGDSVALAAFFPGQDNCVAYLKAVITVSAATDALLLMGSDDGLKVWLNGTVVHRNNIDRGQVVDQDMAPIKLRGGDNELLMKVTQGGGGWSACARIVGTDGQPIQGLQVKPQTDAPPVRQAQPPAVP